MVRIGRIVGGKARSSSLRHRRIGGAFQAAIPDDGLSFRLAAKLRQDIEKLVLHVMCVERRVARGWRDRVSQIGEFIEGLGEAAPPGPVRSSAFVAAPVCVSFPVIPWNPRKWSNERFSIISTKRCLMTDVSNLVQLELFDQTDRTRFLQHARVGLVVGKVYRDVRTR